MVLAIELKAGTAQGMSAQAVQPKAVYLLARDLRLSQRDLILFRKALEVCLQGLVLRFQGLQFQLYGLLLQFRGRCQVADGLGQYLKGLALAGKLELEKLYINGLEPPPLIKQNTGATPRTLEAQRQLKLC